MTLTLETDRQTVRVRACMHVCTFVLVHVCVRACVYMRACVLICTLVYFCIGITTDGDPLFTVQLNEKLSMCYAVHGDPNKVYNLISSPSINVNSYFVNWPIKPELNFHGKIGILACNRECLVANVETCELFVNGELYGDTVYQSSCVEVVRDNDKITVKTLGGYEPVEMLIQCHNIDGAKCLKFQVLNPEGLEELNLKPHGIMGKQFIMEPLQFSVKRLISNRAVTVFREAV